MFHLFRYFIFKASQSCWRSCRVRARSSNRLLSAHSEILFSKTMRTKWKSKIVKGFQWSWDCSRRTGTSRPEGSSLVKDPLEYLSFAPYIFHCAIKLGSTLDDPTKTHAIRKHPALERVTSSLPLILQMLFSLQGCCGICLLMTSWKSSSLEMRPYLSQIVCWCPAQAFLKGKTPSWSSLLTLTFSTTLLAAWGITNLKRKYNRF